MSMLPRFQYIAFHRGQAQLLYPSPPHALLFPSFATQHRFLASPYLSSSVSLIWGREAIQQKNNRTPPAGGRPT